MHSLGTVSAMINGFKEFIMKGNVMDLAVAVIIGAAFAKDVVVAGDETALPAISAIVGSPNFDSFAVLTLRGNELKFGVLLTAIVNFLLIAAAVYFCLVMPMNKMIERRNRRLGIEPAEEAADPNVVLLTEIRDALTAGHTGTAAPGAATGLHEAPGNSAV